MGNWEFNVSRASDVQLGITQRDQFNNDDVGLADALVREVIQNSSDAHSSDEPVKIRFAIKEATPSERREWCALLADLQPHLSACDINYDEISNRSMRVLVVEDFNTLGLTGEFEQKDKQNFDLFWRVMGDSQKAGKSGGRWGLGKLVYSSSSKVQAFFGLTVRQGDDTPALMGQAVLKAHNIGDVYYPAHGFWFEGRSPAPLELQLPVVALREVEKLTRLSGAQRILQPGLSVIIPYLRDGIDEIQIIEGVIKNYFFPILSGKLEVEVGEYSITAESFMEIASGLDIAEDSSIPFDFVEEVSKRLNSEPTATSERLSGNEEIGSESFGPETLLELKELFASGGLVHVRVPMLLEDKKGSEFDSHIDLFMRSLSEGQRSYGLFARGPIVLPAERRNVSGVAAQCAMIAAEGTVTGFLGDAENPAHTQWSYNAEKLTENWRKPKPLLKAVRGALKQLFSLIGEQQENLDQEALIDFFSIADRAQAVRGKRNKSPKPKPEVPKRQIGFTIKRMPGGFEVVPGPAALEWDYPRKIRVRMAYDMIGANPFSRFSRFDFSLKSGSDLKLEAENVSYDVDKDNVLILTTRTPEFSLKVSGFDERRDLVVDARTA